MPPVIFSSLPRSERKLLFSDSLLGQPEGGYLAADVSFEAGIKRMKRLRGRAVAAVGINYGSRQKIDL
jgi:hypothetical protein